MTICHADSFRRRHDTILSVYVKEPACVCLCLSIIEYNLSVGPKIIPRFN